MFEYERTDECLTLRRPGTRWLSNGFDGGYATAPAAHNLTVPEGFERTDLATYAAERLGSPPEGPTLLTGVRQTNARGARYGPVEAVVTAGLSNPALLPAGDDSHSTDTRGDADADASPDDAFRPGTVNVLVGSAEPLSEGGLAGLLATVVEAKAATLVDLVGPTGTTSDAVAVGCPSAEAGAPFAGSATTVGNAARVCVRDALAAALEARYDGDLPDPRGAEHATVTSGEATPFTP
ncbi:adenosylcobinamide amidohydrolase [Natronomonas moolapensis 8.8.11]|uniref:Adenosylcobinamide amidohydrolase n=1 Tax=Natronomonas moolapensis (strain DSM 18674 / CECT 7526 / JCM 14361 / 8.8.11) TaxID=268739 RepID=M1XR06_NATM8|nr:adenosylcobinamide amidohydrolase [Natronomonas moolapensis]CCQ36619.1 adenosylcobinamide amidohydrolase [Natronomonas moolapensis 8.8.11]